ncbi:sigma-54 dependent transcriptional regulator, partial [bacterium]|nr:sigma-54 dependent transcriptional regulator [bacterium]
NHDILISDTRLRESRELELVRRVRTINPFLPIIAVTSEPSMSSAIESLRLSVVDYLAKPVDTASLFEVVRTAIHRRVSLSGQNQGEFSVGANAARPPQKEGNVSRLGNMIGQSKAMKALFTRILKIAQCDSNVLIYGESGTGKELVARTIHERGLRKDKAFIPVDTVALPTNLLESELFGYEKGAFTGAQSMRKGLFEFAHEGTLFLDEITELEPYLQAKLLRVVQERELRRVGGSDLVKVDFRILAATNKEPGQAVQDGLFREDLFYRLNVIPLVLPPLRERKEDIPLLFNHYLNKCERFSNLTGITIDPEALEALKRYQWPGNVRQLINVVEQLLSLLETPRIRLSDLPGEIRCSSDLETSESDRRLRLPYAESRDLVLQEFNAVYFEHLLERCQGNISQAARLAKVDRKTLYRKIK